MGEQKGSSRLKGTLRRFAQVSGAIGKILSRRNYAVFTLFATICVAIAQMFLVMTIFWLSNGLEAIKSGIYFLRYPEPIIPHTNTLFWFATADKTRIIYVTSSQLGWMLLISFMIGVYVSLLIYYGKGCKSCKVETTSGVACSGVGGIASIFTTTVSSLACCGGAVTPLVAGVAFSFFGFAFTGLFSIVSIILITSCIYWVGSKIRF